MIYEQPTTWEALLSALANSSDRPVLLAGGTDWMVERRLGHAPPARVIDLSRVPELTAMREEEAGIWVGAGVTYRTLMADARFTAWPMLPQMARTVGAWQVQQRGTLGGNVATGSPAGDSLPVLVAYAAQVELASVKGSRRVAIDAFYTGYRRTVMAQDEVIAGIWLPRPAEGALHDYRKVGTRQAQAISKVAFAGYRAGGTLRLGMASVAPTVVSLKATAEALLHGQDPILALKRDIAPIDDVRSSAKYRWFVAENLVRAFAQRLEGRP